MEDVESLTEASAPRLHQQFVHGPMGLRKALITHAALRHPWDFPKARVEPYDPIEAPRIPEDLTSYRFSLGPQGFTKSPNNPRGPTLRELNPYLGCFDLLI